MERCIALLGGINVGGHRVKMDHLRTLFETLGFSDVSTFIASGNILFRTPLSDKKALEKQIEQYLLRMLGYNVPTFIRTFQELVSIAHYQPFPSLEHHADTDTLSLLFLADPVSEDIQAHFLAFRTSIDEFHFHHQEIYWLCRKKITESQVDWARMHKTLVMPPVTMRNVTTIRKLVAKYTAPQ